MTAGDLLREVFLSEGVSEDEFAQILPNIKASGGMNIHTEIPEQHIERLRQDCKLYCDLYRKKKNINYRKRQNTKGN